MGRSATRRAEVPAGRWSRIYRKRESTARLWEERLGFLAAHQRARLRHTISPPRPNPTRNKLLGSGTCSRVMVNLD